MPTKPSGHKAVFFRLDSATAERLRQIAKEEDRSVSAIVRIAVKEFLAREEDLER